MPIIHPTASAQLAEAFQSGDQVKMQSAWEAFASEIADGIRADYAEHQRTADDAVLSQRGYRVLTSAEERWYGKVSAALKAADPKQAFISLTSSDAPDDVMPETIIDDVLRYLVETRPLLSKVKIQNVGFSTKWIINDNTVQRGGWGDIEDGIVKEIKGALKVLDLSQSRYSAFCIVPLDLLDMGPTFLDAFVRATLAEALGLGLEEAIVNGTGVDMPTGVTKNPNGAFNASTGYPDKTPVKAKSFAPADYGALVAKVAVTEKGKQRAFSGVTILCSMTDYLTKIMPATTVLTNAGTYANNLFPFPTEVIPCNSVKTGTAVLGVLEDYTLAVGGSKNGVIDYDDSVKFFDYARAFRIVQHAAGRAYDNNSFIVLDISDLDPAYVTVNPAGPATQAMPVAETPETDQALPVA